MTSQYFLLKMGLSPHSDSRRPLDFFANRSRNMRAQAHGVSSAHSHRGRLRSRGPFLKATRLSWFFTEVMEIRILRNMGRPTDNNADQADWFISADEDREWRRQQDENEARIRR